MKCDKHTMLLYAVTDRAWVGPMTLLQQAEAALQNGVTCLQLREKHLDDEAFLAEARQMAALCKRYHVPSSSTTGWTSPWPAAPTVSMWARRTWRCPPSAGWPGRN